MADKRVFSEIIDDYEKARPGYIPEVFNDIIEYSAIKNHGKILEIGSGPGQATDYFVKKKYDITGLEISDKQVKFLLNKYAEYPHFNSICSSFETFDGLKESYNLIFSATAFHWIEPQVGYPKAHDLLKNNGVMAVFWHLASIIEPKTDMMNDIRNIYRKFAPELDDYLNLDEAENLHQLRISQIQTNQLFDKPVTKIYEWDEEYSTERYLKLMNSYSDFHAIEKDKRIAILNNVEAYINNNGSKVIVPQVVRLYMVRKNTEK